jgi:hypothetical protein
MRFTMLARRIAGASALGLVLAMTAAACSSSSSSPSASASSSTAPPSSSAASSPAGSASSSASTLNPAAAVSEITANWEKFFSFSTPTSERVTLLQNGTKFATAIAALSKLPLANGIGAKVTKVVVNSPTSATVTYNITAAGSSLLSNQTGTAVYQDGTWKVGDASLCGLFKLVPGGSVPSACSSAG